MARSGLKRYEYCNSIVMSVATFVLAIVASMSTDGPAFARSDSTTLELQTAAQESKPSDIRELKLGAPIERELAGPESHTYSVLLIAGQYVHIVIDQNSIDVMVSLFGPGGEKLTEMNGPNYAQWHESVSAIADASGSYRVELKALDEKAVAGRYEIKVEQLRESTTQDRSRIASEKALG